MKVLKRPHEKPRANEHHRRKRHLDDHERLAEMKALAWLHFSARKRRSVFLERRRQIKPPTKECWRESEEDSGKNRDRNREREDAPIGLYHKGKRVFGIT